MFTILLIALATLPIIYWYLTRNFNYWSKRGIPGPKPIPIFGNLLQQYITCPFPVQDCNWLNKYGKLYGSYVGNTPVLTVSDPQLIKDILVKDFHVFPDRRFPQINDRIMSKMMLVVRGDDWKRIRSVCSPTFTSGKIKRMFPSMRKCLNHFMSHLDTFAKQGKEVDVKQMYGNYTMDVIASCAFATDTNAHKQLDTPFVVHIRKAFKFNILTMLASLILPSFLLNHLGDKLRGKDTVEAREFFIDTTRAIIEKRKKSTIKSSDFIGLLLEAEADPNVNVRNLHEAHHVNEGEEELESERRALSGGSANRTLSEDEMVAQGLIFFIAGYETTATTLTYCTYELAIHPNIQERLYEEVSDAVNPDTGEVDYEVLAKLPFLDAVLSETLRMHSPILRLFRLSNADYKLADTGLTIEKGQAVDIPIHAIHHSEEYFPEPYKFNPDRFLPENRHHIKPYTYLPFGAGPRNCIGMRFALLEAKLGLVHIIRKYRFTRCAKTAVPLKSKRVFRMNIPSDIIVGLEYR